MSRYHFIEKARYSLSYLNQPLTAERSERWLARLGHLFFVIYLLMCLFFWRERMLHFDTANYSYHLLLSQTFYAGMDRWIGYIPQVLPLVLIQLQAPLWLILLAYSCSICLFYYLIFVWIVYGFKNARIGLWLCLSLCLTLRYKFYAPVGEIVMSFPLIALLLATVDSPKRLRFSWTSWRNAIWPSLLVSGLIFFTAHPFAIITSLLCLGFLMVWKRDWLNLAIWSASLVLIAGSLWKAFDVQNRVYETQRLGQMLDWWSHWANWSEFYALDRLWWYIDTEYHLALVAFGISLWLLIRQKRWFSSLYLIVASFVLVVLVVSLHSYLQGPIYIMLDGYLAHLGSLWSLAIVWVVLAKFNRIKGVLIMLLLLFSLHRIGLKSHFFAEREDYYLSLIEQHAGHPKLLLHERDFVWDQHWLHWASGAETLLMTASLQKERVATVHYLFARDSLSSKERLDSQLILHHFLDEERAVVKELPRHYFPLPQVPYYRIKPTQ